MKTLAEIAAHIGGELHGDGTLPIDRVATLEAAGDGDISFLANPRYTRHLATTKAAAVIITAPSLPACPTAAITVKDPYLGYARAAALLNPPPRVTGGVHATAWVAPGASVHPDAAVGPQCVVEEGAVVAAGVSLGAGCYVGSGAVIGEHSRLAAHVSVCAGCVIGKRAWIQPGAVIGGDGFGLANDGGAWVKIPQLGRVVIGDDVEIGANTTIDRGALDDTVLEDGVKLDNLIQVAHNVRIGAHTVIAGCTGISGSTHIGRHCMIGGGVGIVGHLRIADGVQVTGMSFVHKSIDEPGAYSSGTPLEPTPRWKRNFIRFLQLDDLARRVARLESGRGAAGERESTEATGKGTGLENARDD